MEKLGILNYSPLLPEDQDSESASAIGQVEVYWACYELSPYMQKATFLIAPNAGFDVLFGHQTESIQRGSTQKGKLKVVKGDQVRRYQGTAHRQEQPENCEGQLCEMSFARGIKIGTLVPVDNEARDAARRPSIADLEKYYQRRAATDDALDVRGISASQAGPVSSGVEISSHLPAALRDSELNPRTKRQELRDESFGKRRRSALFEAFEVDPVTFHLRNPEKRKGQAGEQLDGNEQSEFLPNVRPRYEPENISLQINGSYDNANLCKVSRAADARSPSKRQYNYTTDIELRDRVPTPNQDGAGTPSPPRRRRRRRGKSRTGRQPGHSKGRSIDSSSFIQSSQWHNSTVNWEVLPSHNSEDSGCETNRHVGCSTTPIYALAQDFQEQDEPLTPLQRPKIHSEPVIGYSRSGKSRQQSLTTTPRTPAVSDQEINYTFHSKTDSISRSVADIVPESNHHTDRGINIPDQQQNDHIGYYAFGGQHDDSLEYNAYPK